MNVHKRITHLLFVLLSLSAITFAFVDLLPGDAAYVIAGDQTSPEALAAIRSEHGLDKNIVSRYLIWLKRIFHGEFGKSLIDEEPVFEAIATRLPVTLELLVLSQILALCLAIPVAMFCATKPNSAIDRIFGAAAFASMSVPSYIMAIVLILIFALHLDWLPASSFSPISGGLVKNLQSIALPALSIALVEWVPLMRVLRSDLIATLHSDFILLARSKGLNQRQVLFRHALRPSSLTLVTIFGLQVGHLIGGSVVIEFVFALPGIGRLLVEAIYSRDYMVIQGCILIITLGYVLVNFLVDMLYSIIDPRIRVNGA